mmetsp:Transcript_29480/g.64472  ORF Transcript_29480/g.64472 Transcript_29480/m.64472 type:complete len:327 (+) Transcript_29480:839-1819(+)
MDLLPTVISLVLVDEGVPPIVVEELEGRFHIPHRGSDPSRSLPSQQLRASDVLHSAPSVGQFLRLSGGRSHELPGLRFGLVLNRLLCNGLRFRRHWERSRGCQGLLLTEDSALLCSQLLRPLQRFHQQRLRALLLPGKPNAHPAGAWPGARQPLEGETLPHQLYLPHEGAVGEASRLGGRGEVLALPHKDSTLRSTADDLPDHRRGILASAGFCGRGHRCRFCHCFRRDRGLRRSLRRSLRHSVSRSLRRNLRHGLRHGLRHSHRCSLRHRLRRRLHRRLHRRLCRRLRREFCRKLCRRLRHKLCSSLRGIPRMRHLLRRCCERAH